MTLPIRTEALAQVRGLLKCSCFSRGEISSVDIHGLASLVLNRYADGECNRIIVGIGGFPASGKSTLAKRLAEMLSENHDLKSVHFPMDGFHLSNNELDETGLNSVKGRLDTYNVDLIIEKISEIFEAKNKTVKIPDYDRSIHDVVQNSIAIDPDVKVIIMEGLYIGYPFGKWQKIAESLSLSCFLATDPEVCVQRIVSRNIAVGRHKRTIDTKILNDIQFMRDSVFVYQSADFIIDMS